MLNAPPEDLEKALMQYKGYTADIQPPDENGVIRGRVAGIRDMVTFQGKTDSESQQAFKDSVDDYLEFCRNTGGNPVIAPEKLRQAIRSRALRPPKERFQDMVDRGAIDSEGRVLLRGPFDETVDSESGSQDQS